MVRCGYCGGPLNIDTNNYRAERVHTYQYLYCSNNAHGHPCTAKRIRYVPFELSFMHHVESINFREVFNEGDNEQMEKLEFDCFEKKKQLTEVEASIANLLAIMADGKSNEAAQKMLTNQLNVYAERKQTLEKEHYHLDTELKTRQYRWQEPDELHNDIVEFYDKLNGLADDELYVARSKLAQIVNSVVDKIYIYMDGWPQGTHKKGDQIIYRIQFQNGAFRVTCFGYDNPEDCYIVLEKVKLPQ